MRQGLMGGVLGLGLTAMMIGTPFDEAAAQGKKGAPGWLNNYQTARMEAKKTGKPMFLVFR